LCCCLFFFVLLLLLGIAIRKIVAARLIYEKLYKLTSSKKLIIKNIMFLAGENLAGTSTLFSVSS
jgi:hypothetical protein